MKVVKPGTEILTPIDADAILQRIEVAGRRCYKSEDKITPDSAKKFVRGIMSSGHHSVIEHESVSVNFIIPRGISHELVRHRLAAYSQESTRYCNYAKKGEKGEVTFILEPAHHSDHAKYESVLRSDEEAGFISDDYYDWRSICSHAEKIYLRRRGRGISPQIARNGLPIALKTEIVATYNLRTWRHIFQLRAAGTTGKPHPQMLEVMIPLLAEFKEKIPVIFDDIEPMAMPEFK